MAETVFDRARAIQGSSLTMGQKFLTLLLNQFCGENGECWPSHQTLARAMSCSDRAVRKWQGELERRGVVRMVQGGGRGAANRYSLDLSRLPANTEPRSAFLQEESATNPEPRSAFSGAVQALNPERRSTKPGTSFQQTRNHVPPNRKGNRKGKDQARAAVPVPETLASSPAFESAWKDWLAYRRERRKALTPKTAERQLSKLARWGADKAIRAIERSIESGWLGIFDPDDNRGTGSGPAGSTEALEAWDRLRAALREHSSLNASAVRAAVGEAIFAAAKNAGGLKSIEQATDFERRDIQNRFNSSFTKGCNR
jgi:hypothetical protein